MGKGDRHAPVSIPNRYELKYLVPDSVSGQVREALRPYCTLDRFAAAAADHQYTITSLYLDTPSRAFHRAKIERQHYRFKLRIRTYGELSDGPVFFEVKRKIGDIVAKNRALVPRGDWVSRLTGANPRDASSAELDFRSLMDSHGAIPMLLARYSREAWLSSVDDYARVTFDRRLVYQPVSSWDLLGRPGAWLAQDDVTATRMVGRATVLELKATRHVPSWMIGLIRRIGLIRSGYSKYCTGVERLWGDDRLDRFDDRAAIWV